MECPSCKSDISETAESCGVCGIKIEPLIVQSSHSESALLPDQFGSPFVGRDREINILQKMLSRAREGRGQIVGLVGDAAIGKSRLLVEFRRKIFLDGVKYLEGRCRQNASSYPYVPILDVLRSDCGIATSDAPEAIAGKLFYKLKALDIYIDGPSAPYLLNLFGIKEWLERLAHISPDAIKEGTFEALTKLILHSSWKSPIVVAFEDIHWADKTSQDYFSLLIEKITDASILLLYTYRPEYQPPWHEKSCSTEIRLRPLTLDESREVIHLIDRGRQLSTSRVEEIVGKADGNPLFLGELTQQAITEPSHTSSLRMSDTIRNAITARVDFLPYISKRLLQTASILGREFSFHFLEAIWDGGDQVDVPLRDLERRNLLEELPFANEPKYRFKHILIQEAVYDGVPLTRRHALHTKVAHILEESYRGRLEEVIHRLAYHFSRSGDSNKAIEHLFRSAERSAKINANEEALEALEEALGHTGQLTTSQERNRRRLEIALRQANSLIFLGRFTQCRNLLLEKHALIEALSDPSLAGVYYLLLGHSYSLMGDRSQAAENIERCLRVAPEIDKATRGKAHFVLAHEGFWSGKHEHGISNAQKAISLLHNEIEERRWLGMSHWVCAPLYTFMGYFDKALEAVTTARKIGEEIGDFRLQAFCGAITGQACGLKGDYEAGIQACQLALSVSRDPVSEALTQSALGHIYVENRDLQQAIPLLEQAVKNLGQFNHLGAQSRTAAYLSEAYLLNGQITAALDTAHLALDVAELTQYHWAAGYAHRALGWIAEASGDFHKAKSHFIDALSTFNSIDARFDSGRTYLALAQLTKRHGTIGDAKAYLDKAYWQFGSLRAIKEIERTEQRAKEWDIVLPLPIRTFVLHQPVELEETRHSEFKEITGKNPVDSIKNTADDYAVAFLNKEGGAIFWGVRDKDRIVVGVRLSYQQRDEIRREVCNMLAQIQPPLPISLFNLNFYPVSDEQGQELNDIWVFEVDIPAGSPMELYATGSGEVFVKTDGGKQRLSHQQIIAEIRRRTSINRDM